VPAARPAHRVHQGRQVHSRCARVCVCVCVRVW
jgi:hypothetical protein